MEFQDTLLDLLALKRGGRFDDAPCIYCVHRREKQLLGCFDSRTCKNHQNSSNPSGPNHCPRVLWLGPESLSQSILAQAQIPLPEYSGSGKDQLPEYTGLDLNPSYSVLCLRLKTLSQSTLRASTRVLWESVTE